MTPWILPNPAQISSVSRIPYITNSRYYELNCMSLHRDFPSYDELFYEFSPLFGSTFSSVYIYHYFWGGGIIFIGKIDIGKHGLFMMQKIQKIFE